MKVIIDIGENLYTRLFDNGIETSLEDRKVIDKAIRNGTPLPKGHGRLGDLDALAHQILWKGRSTCHAQMEEHHEGNCIGGYNLSVVNPARHWNHRLGAMEEMYMGQGHVAREYPPPH